MPTEITLGDILEWCDTYDGPKFHAIMCDPPYHLVEITRRFGKDGSAPPQYGTDGVFQRSAAGFMGRDWDGLDDTGMGVAFDPETWRKLGGHLHPGGFLFAFAGTRGYHRMASAIEDAGFRIHPAIAWGFGSGFPKATRIDTQVDRRAKAPRKVTGRKKHASKFAAAELGYREKDNGFNSRERESFDLTEPATDLAKTWEGHRYGGQVLKPAFEFICVAEWPAKHKLDSILETGAGALWIDGARIGTDSTRRPQASNGSGYHGRFGEGMYGSEGDRWPANLLLTHAPECTEDGCAEGCPALMLGRQSGKGKTGTVDKRTRSHKAYDSTVTMRAYDNPIDYVSEGSTGTAARFFHQSDWMYERLELADPLLYVPKVATSEREAGLDPKQVALMRELYGVDVPEGEGDEVDNRYHHRTRQCTVCGTRSNDGQGSTSCGHDDWEWVAQRVHEAFPEGTINDGRNKPIDNAYQRGKTPRRNLHATLKPIALNRHLATLLLPPAAYAPRRLLIPFAGVGSEMIGAMLAGWDEVIGVELTPEHIPIAKARLAYWAQMAHKFDQGQKVKVKAPKQDDPKQGDLFAASSAFEAELERVGWSVTEQLDGQLRMDPGD